MFGGAPPAAVVADRDDVLSLSRWLFVNLDNAARFGDVALVTFLLRALSTAVVTVAAAPGRHQHSFIGEALTAMSSAVWSDPDIVRALVHCSGGGGGGGGGGGNNSIGGGGGRGWQQRAIPSEINRRDPVTGQQPLHIATHLGHRVAVRALLLYGADVNAVVDPPHPPPSSAAPPFSAAAAAAAAASASESTRSLSDFALPKSLLRGMSALHWAALRGYLEIVEDLVMSGADLEARVSHSGETALHLAARRGEEAVVDVLLGAGSKWSVLSSSNLTPMDLAALSNHPGTLGAFLCRGIDPNAKNPLGYTALHQAAYNNSCDTLRLLLECAGAGVNSATDGTGYTPLHVAALFSTNTDRRHSSSSSSSTSSGTTTLNNNSSDNNNNCHYCCTKSSSSSPPPRRPSSSCSSAVLTIGRYGGTLLQVDAVDGNGWTPLRTACVNLREGAVRDLLDIGADETLVEDLLLPSSDQSFVLKKNMSSSGNGSGAGASTAGNSGRLRAESIARVRAILVAAATDRAWRRRGWLVVLRTAEKNRRAAAVAGGSSADNNHNCGGGGGGGGGSGRAQRGSPKKRRAMASSSSSSSSSCDVENVVHTGTAAAAAAAAAAAVKAARRGCCGDGELRRLAGGGGSFAALVEKLAALEDDALFRKITLFL